MPNSREVATMIWLGVALIASLFSAPLRSSLGRVLVMLVRWKIAIPIPALAANTAALAYGGSKIGLHRRLRANEGRLRGFAACMRQELTGTGVGVSVVFPGSVRDAGMWADTGAAGGRGT